jgi:hypothetical protein
VDISIVLVMMSPVGPEREADLVAIASSQGLSWKHATGDPAEAVVARGAG